MDGILSVSETNLHSVHTILQNLGRSDHIKIAKSVLKFSNLAILQDFVLSSSRDCGASGRRKAVGNRL